MSFASLFDSFPSQGRVEKGVNADCATFGQSLSSRNHSPDRIMLPLQTSQLLVTRIEVSST